MPLIKQILSYDFSSEPAKIVERSIPISNLNSVDKEEDKLEADSNYEDYSVD